jgi:hypothetical protein
MTMKTRKIQTTTKTLNLWHDSPDLILLSYPHYTFVLIISHDLRTKQPFII